MAEVSPRFPAEEQALDQRGLFRLPFLTWFRNLRSTLDEAPQKVTDGVVDRTGLGAAISTTAIPTASLDAGLYRVTYAARISQAATTSSSLTVTISWTRSSVAMSFPGAAMTGNATTTFQSETKMIKIDAASPVSYATAYSSTGATAMQYELAVVLERVNT